MRKFFAMIVPVAIAFAVAAATLSPNVVLAFTGGMYYGRSPSDTHSADLPFNDVTEQLEYFEYDNGQMSIKNTQEQIVVCLVGKSYFSTSPSPSPDGSTRMRRGYNDKKDYIPLNGVSGQFLFHIPAGETKLLSSTLTGQLATIQCATVDYYVSKRCRPGMNIHSCIKQGL